MLVCVMDGNGFWCFLVFGYCLDFCLLQMLFRGKEKEGEESFLNCLEKFCFTSVNLDVIYKGKNFIEQKLRFVI